MCLMKHCKSPFFVSLKEVFLALSYSKASLRQMTNLILLNNDGISIQKNLF